MPYSNCAYTSGDASTSQRHQSRSSRRPRVDSPYTCSGLTDSCTYVDAQWSCASAFSTPWFSCLTPMLADSPIDSSCPVTATPRSARRSTCTSHRESLAIETSRARRKLPRYYFLSTATNVLAAGSSANLVSPTSTAFSAPAFTLIASGTTAARISTATSPPRTSVVSNSLPASTISISPFTNSPSTTPSSSDIIGMVTEIVGTINTGIALCMCCRKEQRTEKRMQQRLGKNSDFPLPQYPNRDGGRQNAGANHNYVVINYILHKSHHGR